MTTEQRPDREDQKKKPGRLQSPHVPTVDARIHAPDHVVTELDALVPQSVRSPGLGCLDQASRQKSGGRQGTGVAAHDKIEVPPRDPIALDVGRARLHQGDGRLETRPRHHESSAVPLDVEMHPDELVPHGRVDGQRLDGLLQDLGRAGNERRVDARPDVPAHHVADPVVQRDERDTEQRGHQSGQRGPARARLAASVSYRLALRTKHVRRPLIPEVHPG